MKTKKECVQKIRQIPPGFRPSRKKAPQIEERQGVKCWLIRSAKDDREVVVVDAVAEDEALQRAYSLSGSLKMIGAWPALPVIYAEEHPEGPVCITWFREAFFRALSDQQQAT